MTSLVLFLMTSLVLQILCIDFLFNIESQNAKSNWLSHKNVYYDVIKIEPAKKLQNLTWMTSQDVFDVINLTYAFYDLISKSKRAKFELPMSQQKWRHFWKILLWRNYDDVNNSKLIFLENFW